MDDSVGFSFMHTVAPNIEIIDSPTNELLVEKGHEFQKRLFAEQGRVHFDEIGVGEQNTSLLSCLRLRYFRNAGKKRGAADFQIVCTCKFNHLVDSRHVDQNIIVENEEPVVLLDDLWVGAEKVSEILEHGRRL